MTDSTPDIDGLLRYLKSGHTPHWYDDSTRWRAALTALVAERNELTARVRNLKAVNSTYEKIVAERDALKQRVAELTGDLNVLVADRSVSTERLDAAKKRIAELEAHPPASDLRERDETLIRWMDQVTVMLCHSMTHSHDAKQELVARCDKAIDAMRKGDECNR